MISPFHSTSPVVVDGIVSDKRLSQLLGLQAEYPELDYKTRIEVNTNAGLVEFAKDVGAFQVLGGYIIGGVDGAGTPTGDMDGVNPKPFDEANIVPKLLGYLPEPLKIRSQFYERNGHAVVLIFVGWSPSRYAIFRKDGQYETNSSREIAFRAGDLFWRNGTRSERVSHGGLEAIIEWRITTGRALDPTHPSLALSDAVERYLRFLRESGKTARTVQDYTSYLRRFAREHTGLDLADFEPRAGTERLRDYIDQRWGSATPGTRRKVTTLFQGFFRWCLQEDLVRGDAAVRLSRPKRHVAAVRHTLDPELVRRIIDAQPELSDRVALQLLAHLALHKNELRLLDWGDVNLMNGLVLVTRRGKVESLRIAPEELLRDMEQLKQEVRPRSSDFVLHPRRGGDKERKPYEPSSLHRWWKRRLAEVEAAPDISLRDFRGSLRAKRSAKR